MGLGLLMRLESWSFGVVEWVGSYGCAFLPFFFFSVSPLTSSFDHESLISFNIPEKWFRSPCYFIKKMWRYGLGNG